MDLRATLGYEALKQDGAQLFIKTMSNPDAGAGARVATDLQTLFESAWNQKGQAGGAMMLCRLVGYIEGMGNTLGSLQSAGVRFIATEGENGKSSMRVELMPGTASKAPSGKPKEEPAGTDIDKLEGPEYEAALAKLTPAEREKYLVAA